MFFVFRGQGNNGTNDEKHQNKQWIMETQHKQQQQQQQHDKNSYNSNSASGAAVVIPQQVQPQIIIIRSSDDNNNDNNSSGWKTICLGQLLSFLLACTGASQSTLQLRCGVNAPMFTVGLVYLCLSFLLIPLYRKETTTTRRRNNNNSNNYHYEHLDIPIQNHQQHHQQQQQQDAGQQQELQSINNSTINDSIRNNHNTQNCYNTSFSFSSSSNNDTTIPVHSTTHNHRYRDNPYYFSILGIVLPPLHHLRHIRSVWVYVLMSFLDVQANYVTVLSFRYTTLTSITLFDALAIPSAMLFSLLFFGKDQRGYTKYHLLGVFVCMIGICLNVLQDYRQDHAADGDNDTTNVNRYYPHKFRGDLLAITGGMLYGLNDVFTEYAVRGHENNNNNNDNNDNNDDYNGNEQNNNHYDANNNNNNHVSLGRHGNNHIIMDDGGMIRTNNNTNNNNNSNNFREKFQSVQEYLGVIGLFASVIAFVQALLVEREETMELFTNNNNTCTIATKIALTSMFVFASVLSYFGISLFLTLSESTFLNLSLLTGDFWSLLFTVFIQHIHPSPLFYGSVFFVVVGVVLYEKIANALTPVIRKP